MTERTFFRFSTLLFTLSSDCLLRYFNCRDCFLFLSLPNAHFIDSYLRSHSRRTTSHIINPKHPRRFHLTHSVVDLNIVFNRHSGSSPSISTSEITPSSSNPPSSLDAYCSIANIHDITFNRLPPATNPAPPAASPSSPDKPSDSSPKKITPAVPGASSPHFIAVGLRRMVVCVLEAA